MALSIVQCNATIRFKVLMPKVHAMAMQLGKVWQVNRLLIILTVKTSHQDLSGPGSNGVGTTRSISNIVM